MKNRLFLAIALIFVISITQAPAQTQLSSKNNYSENTSESVGVSASKINQLDLFIESYMDQKAVPGGVFLVARKGKIVYFKSFGNRSMDSNEPYKKDDIFRIASMTKAITTTAIMQLYENGKLGLDDPVHYYIPAFKEMTVLEEFNTEDSTYTTVPANKKITIRHLLTHTSGIVYGDFMGGSVKLVYEDLQMTGVGLSHDSWTTEEFIDRLAKVPLAFQPGEKYTYGLNMDVLGRVVEVVSEMSLSDYFQKNIFTPLGMNDTHFYLPKEKHDRLTPLYTPNENGGLQMMGQDATTLGFDYPTKEGRNHYAGGGGLSSTAMDYYKFIQTLANYGTYNGKRILSRNTIETMTSDQMMLLNQEGKGFSKLPGLTYCLGFALFTEDAEGYGPKSPGTYEWGGYFNTKYFIDPEEEVIFVGMTQVLPFYRNDFWDRMYSMIYGSIID
jgi:CubicO group peptidase (beta-lactamase class C family)